MQTLVEYSPYTLSFTHGGEREGALLKFTFSDGESGYADCHPWEQFGDGTVRTQLNLLKRGEWTPLTARCRDNAFLDAKARKERFNLFSGKDVPDSHYLLMDLIDPIDLYPPLKEGFRAIKVKSLDLSKMKEIAAVLRPYEARIRFDFNGKFSRKEALFILELLSPYRDVIDFIEDLFPYEEKVWTLLQEQYGIPFAVDHTSRSAPFIQVVKPSKCLPLLNEEKPVVITSYLGHPLGQLQDAYVAALMQGKRKMNLCGLNSHRAYQPNRYSKYLSQKGPQFILPSGTGFGFDDLLEKENWRVL